MGPPRRGPGEGIRRSWRRPKIKRYAALSVSVTKSAGPDLVESTFDLSHACLMSAPASRAASMAMHSASDARRSKYDAVFAIYIYRFVWEKRDLSDKKKREKHNPKN